jgi:hypothetical protein
MQLISEFYEEHQKRWNKIGHVCGFQISSPGAKSPVVTTEHISLEDVSRFRFARKSFFEHDDGHRRSDVVHTSSVHQTSEPNSFNGELRQRIQGNSYVFQDQKRQSDSVIPISTYDVSDSIDSSSSSGSSVSQRCGWSKYRSSSQDDGDSTLRANTDSSGMSDRGRQNGGTEVGRGWRLLKKRVLSTGTTFDQEIIAGSKYQQSSALNGGDGGGNGLPLRAHTNGEKGRNGGEKGWKLLRNKVLDKKHRSLYEESDSKHRSAPLFRQTSWAGDGLPQRANSIGGVHSENRSRNGNVEVGKGWRKKVLTTRSATLEEEPDVDAGLVMADTKHRFNGLGEGNGESLPPQAEGGVKENGGMDVVGREGPGKRSTTLGEETICSPIKQSSFSSTTV